MGAPPDAAPPDAAPPDAPPLDAALTCPAGQVGCEGACIPEGTCCGLVASGIDHTVRPANDLRRVTVSARTILTSELSSDADTTSALVVEGGRLWFTYASTACHGPATVTFAPLPTGEAVDIERHCEHVDGVVTAASLTRDRNGLLGCFSNPVRGSDVVRCGRWPSGPGSWTALGPPHTVVSARWLDDASSPLTAWSVATDGATHLALARFDASMNLTSERVIAVPSDDIVTGSAVVDDVRWLLRQPASRAQGPLLERLRGDARLPPIDVGALDHFRDWQGSLAVTGRGVTLLVQTPTAVTFLQADDAGVRGRVVLYVNAFGSGAVTPYEGGWLYAGAFQDGLNALRMDCAGRLREDRVNLGFVGSLQRFGGLAPSPDGRGFWVLATEHIDGLVRSVVRVGA